MVTSIVVIVLFI